MANGHGGRRKGGGRKKGATNRISAIQKVVNGQTREELWAYCDSLGTNPFHVLADICADKKADIRLRVQCASELAPFLLPKLRQVEAELGEKTRRILEFRYANTRADNEPAS